MKVVMKKIESILSEFKRNTGNRINYVVALQQDIGEHHVQQIRLDVFDDHHLLDIQTGIMEAWQKANHQEGENTCATS